MHQRFAIAWLLCLIGGVAAADDLATEARQGEFFEKEVRPVLASVCQQCHGETKQEGNLRLDSRAAAEKGGDYGPAIVPGRADESWLVKAIRYDQDDLQMPPTGRLTDAQIAALTAWVAEGAYWPTASGAAAESNADVPVTITAEDRAYWAFQPILRVVAPTVQAADWPRTDIDRFILAGLEHQGLKPVEDADRLTWLRRVTFDLIGLPPTLEEIEGFVNDMHPLAWERVVDRLLNSPAFGERWGRHWLDITYFADTTGVGRRSPLRDAWRYRDYVIQAFNRDKSYRRFVREQIAGDLMPFADDQQREEQLVATGYLVLGPWHHFAADKEQMRMDIVDLQIDAMGRTFLGLTLGCARCHDHKFDPLPTRDYYALAGIFKSTRTIGGRGGWTRISEVDLPAAADEQQRYADDLAAWETRQQELASEQETLTKRQAALKQQLASLREDAKVGVEAGTLDPQAQQTAKEEIDGLEKELGESQRRASALDRDLGFWKEVRPTPKRAFAAVDVEKPEDARINRRGNPHVLGDVAPRGFPEVLRRSDALPPSQDHSGRMELADWLASERNPLTARVYVNRLWMHLFGKGLVATVDNFGERGERPTHPALLDYLAARLIELDWSTKRLIREIVLSHTYGLGSTTDPRNERLDPDDRGLWRMRPRRLEAEAIRDAVLAVSGQLDGARGGYTLPVTRENLHVNTPSFLEDDARIEPHIKFRRSVYMPIMRGSLLRELDVLTLFDFSDPDQIIGVRSATTVPTQALFLLNSPFMKEAADRLARRVLSAAGATDERIANSHRLVLGRPASRDEISGARAFIHSLQADIRATAADAEHARLEAWSRYFHSLLMSAEFLFRR